MRISILAFLVALAGCGATLQTYERLSQESDREITTHVGGQVFKVKRTTDLPNVFGKADIFGGQVDGGFTELRFQGIAQDGRAVFRVTEIETQSTETTMSRYGSSKSELKAQLDGNRLTGTITTYDAPRGSTEMLPPNTTQFAVDLNKSKQFTVAGIKVRVMAITETSLTYILQR